MKAQFACSKKNANDASFYNFSQPYRSSVLKRIDVHFLCQQGQWLTRPSNRALVRIGVELGDGVAFSVGEGTLPLPTARWGFHSLRHGNPKRFVVRRVYAQGRQCSGKLRTTTATERPQRTLRADR